MRNQIQKLNNNLKVTSTMAQLNRTVSMILEVNNLLDATPKNVSKVVDPQSESRPSKKEPSVASLNFIYVSEEHRKRTRKILKTLDKMWDEHLGKTSFPSHRITLKTEARLVTQCSYRTRPKNRKVVAE